MCGWPTPLWTLAYLNGNFTIWLNDLSCSFHRSHWERKRRVARFSTCFFIRVIKESGFQTRKFKGKDYIHNPAQTSHISLLSCNHNMNLCSLCFFFMWNSVNFHHSWRALLPCIRRTCIQPLENYGCPKMPWTTFCSQRIMFRILIFNLCSLDFFGITKSAFSLQSFSVHLNCQFSNFPTGVMTFIKLIWNK